MTTTSNKLSSSLTGKASVLSLSLLIVASVLFAAPSSAMAQQQTTTELPTTAPLTPEEQQEQDRLQNVTTAITRNLQQGEMQVNGIVYTPRWSNPVWVQPNSLSVLFEYCLPGEFADSGQQILGGSELEVLESYSIALSSDLTGWLIVVENEHQTERIPAAVGVICASDANDIDTRILNEQEQTVIKNVVQQFITIRNIQKTNITQIINIINNITNQTGGNQTGNQTDGGDGNETLTVTATWEPIGIGPGNITDTFAFRATVEGGTEPYTYEWDFGDGQTATGQNVQHTYENAQDQREYNATVTVTDAAGQTASDTTEVHTTRPGGIEPLRVNAYWDTTDGGTAPATYSLEADASGGSDVDPNRDYTFQWDFGDGQTSAPTGNCCEFHTYEKPGQYTATVTVTDDSGQTASDSTTFGVGTPSALSVEISPELMSGQAAPATWSFTVKMYDPVSNNRSDTDYTYHWDFGDGQTSDSPGRTTTHTYENPGVYYPQVTVTDPEGNTATSDSDECCRIVVQSPSFEVQITRDIQDGTEAPSTWCFEPAFVTGAEGVPPYSYTWDFGDGTTSSDREVCHTFEQAGDYEVTLTVHDSAGGEASASTTIRVLPPLEPTTGGENVTTTEEEPSTTNETAAVVTPPPTTGGEETTDTTTPPTTTEEEGGTTTTPETPTGTEGGAASEQPSAGTTTTTGGEDATTPP